MRENISTPVVVIDCPRNRIRIHRNGLRLLGDPDYIILMVNPANLTFAILPSTKLHIAHAVHRGKIARSQCFELYSKPFIRQLCHVCPGWNGTERFRVAGEYIREENVIRFDLIKAEERSVQL